MVGTKSSTVLGVLKEDDLNMQEHVLVLNGNGFMALQRIAAPEREGGLDILRPVSAGKTQEVVAELSHTIDGIVASKNKDGRADFAKMRTPAGFFRSTLGYVAPSSGGGQWGTTNRRAAGRGWS